MWVPKRTQCMCSFKFTVYPLCAYLVSTFSLTNLKTANDVISRRDA